MTKKELKFEDTTIQKLKQLKPLLKQLKKHVFELEEENQSLEEIIAILPGHIYWKNRKGALLGCNNEQAFAAGLKSRKNIVGLKPIDLIKKDQPESERIKQAKAIEQIDQKVMSEDITLSVEEQAVLEDSSIGYFISNKTPLHDKKGKVTGLAGVTLDITPLKNLEKQLETTNKNKSKFIINLGSLVRDALSAVVGTADVLHQTNLSKKQARCADLIHQGTKKVIPLLNRLNDYVDLEDNNLSAENNIFNLKAFLKTLIEEHASLATQKSLNIHLNYDNKLPTWVEGGEYFLLQAMNSVLSSVIKFTKKGQIKISANKCSALTKNHFSLEIKIENLNSNMSEAALKNLFGIFDGDNDNNFVRADLDLSIAAKMLSLIGATIKVNNKKNKKNKKDKKSKKSKKNNGVMFIVTIPLRKSNPPKKSNSDLVSLYYPKDEKLRLIKPMDSPIRVLIFDDDLLWQQALKLMLEEAYNCKIDQLTTDNDIASTIKVHYDIVFMDVYSPNGEYLDFAKKYKSKHKSNTPPMIATTACASDDQREKMNEAGMTDIIAKPVNYSRLVDIVDYYVFQEHPNN